MDCLNKEVKYNVKGLPLFVDEIELRDALYHTDIHHHLDVEFIYVLRGSLDYNIEGEIISIQRGNGLFVNSERIHHGFSNYSWDCTFIKLNISPNLLVRLDPSFKEKYKELYYLKNDYIEINRFNHRNILEIIEQINELKDEEDSTLIIAAKALELFSLIYKGLETTKNKKDKDLALFVSMVEYLDAHYTGNVIIEHISKSLHISRNRCCDVFMKYSGMTFSNFLSFYRLNKAIVELQEGKKTVGDVALDCGFSSSSYFSNIFRKATGISPKQYQLDYKKNSRLLK